MSPSELSELMTKIGYYISSLLVLDAWLPFLHSIDEYSGAYGVLLGVMTLLFNIGFKFWDIAHQKVNYGKHKDD